MTISLKVKGSRRSVPAEADTPLLDVLGNDLAFNGAAFGCGLIPGEISARTNWGRRRSAPCMKPLISPDCARAGVPEE
jgi:hypothetical protein